MLYSFDTVEDFVNFTIQAVNFAFLLKFFIKNFAELQIFRIAYHDVVLAWKNYHLDAVHAKPQNTSVCYCILTKG